MKLTNKQKSDIRQEFFENVTDPKMRHKILTVAFTYAEESDEPDALEQMVWYMSQPENSEKLDEQYELSLGSSSEYAQEGATKKPE